MIKITETKITNISKNKYKELRVSFIIKFNDYTKEQEDILYDLSESGQVGALGFQSTEFIEKKSKSQLLQHLACLMSKYVEEKGGDMDILLSGLYEKNKVDSRKDLTIEQLEKEIEIFRDGLKYD